MSLIAEPSGKTFLEKSISYCPKGQLGENKPMRIQLKMILLKGSHVVIFHKENKAAAFKEAFPWYHLTLAELPACVPPFALGRLLLDHWLGFIVLICSPVCLSSKQTVMSRGS